MPIATTTVSLVDNFGRDARLTTNLSRDASSDNGTVIYHHQSFLDRIPLSDDTTDEDDIHTPPISAQPVSLILPSEEVSKSKDHGVLAPHITEQNISASNYCGLFSNEDVDLILATRLCKFTIPSSDDA